MKNKTAKVTIAQRIAVEDAFANFTGSNDALLAAVTDRAMKLGQIRTNARRTAKQVVAILMDARKFGDAVNARNAASREANKTAKAQKPAGDTAPAGCPVEAVVLNDTQRAMLERLADGPQIITGSMSLGDSICVGFLAKKGLASIVRDRVAAGEWIKTADITPAGKAALAAPVVKKVRAAKKSAGGLNDKQREVLAVLVDSPRGKFSPTVVDLGFSITCGFLAKKGLVEIDQLERGGLKSFTITAAGRAALAAK